jgi:glutamate synthase (ferredoxin)
MTGGRVVVLGPTGRNFAAGMSGGIAYVLDEQGGFASLCNQEMVDLVATSPEDHAEIRQLIEQHVAATKSVRGRQVLDQFASLASRFVKVYPRDYRRVLEAKVAAAAAARQPVAAAR